MAVQEKMGLRHGHPTAWKFRHWSAPDDRDGLRRLAWANGIGDLKHGPKENDLIVPKLFEEQPFQLNNLADEGEQDFADVYFDDQPVRATLYIRGYNDPSPAETDTLATLTNEVTGSGYTPLPYTRGTDWTAAAGVATGATKTWTATGAWTAMTMVAIATVDTGTAGLHIAYVNLSATRTLANGETLDITPTVTVT